MSKFGAEFLSGSKCSFSVWAPEREKMILQLVHSRKQEIVMQKNEMGYFTALVENVAEDCRYSYNPENKDSFPDPSSGFQPEGVHGPSQVVNHRSFKWTDQAWRGIPLKDLILYEIHIGTFPEGTFDAIIPRLDEIYGSGINAIEIMPVSQFPGNRNWGYDGVFLYSVQNSYGGSDGLKRLVDACHSKGIAVFLDVVYNHLGPEGNYLSQFGPYFTNKYHVPWGDAVNFDDDWCDRVREYFSENLCFWFEMYHLDGVRVDAIHMVFDTGAVHFWELARTKIDNLEQRVGRKFYLIAESDFNSLRVVKSPEMGGYGFDAQWLDDFHHALYVLLDTKGSSRYEDFGYMEQLAKAYSDGFVHSGDYVKFRRRKHGASSVGLPGERFVAFNQNHDQIGNRVKGERLSVLVDFDRLKLASAALFLSPYIPLLFMGEEYGEDAPFYYFVSHGDKELVKAVREGRKKEFAGYKWKTDPPDPQAESTFKESKIDWNRRNSGKHKLLLDWNKELIRLRKENPALRSTDKNDLKVFPVNNKGLILHRRSSYEQHYLICFMNFGDDETTFSIPSLFSEWYKILGSTDAKWHENPKRGNNSVPDIIKAGNSLTINGCNIVVYSNKQI